MELTQAGVSVRRGAFEADTDTQGGTHIKARASLPKHLPVAKLRSRATHPSLLREITTNFFVVSDLVSVAFVYGNRCWTNATSR